MWIFILAQLLSAHAADINVCVYEGDDVSGQAISFTGYDSMSQWQAEQEAQSECTRSDVTGCQFKDCTTERTGLNEDFWVCRAEGTKNGARKYRFAGTGRSEDSAQQKALQNCQDYAFGCAQTGTCKKL